LNTKSRPTITDERSIASCRFKVRSHAAGVRGRVGRRCGVMTGTVLREASLNGPNVAATTADPKIRGPFPISLDTLHGLGAVDFDVLANQARFVNWCGCPGNDLAAVGRQRRSADHRRKASGDGGAGQGISRLPHGAVPGRAGQGHSRDAGLREARREAGAGGDHFAPPDSGRTEDDLRQYWRALAAVAQRP